MLSSSLKIFQQLLRCESTKCSLALFLLASRLHRLGICASAQVLAADQTVSRSIRLQALPSTVAVQGQWSFQASFSGNQHAKTAFEYHYYLHPCKLSIPLLYWQAGLHQDAAKLAVGVESQELSLSLQIAIKYEQNDLAGQCRLDERYLTCRMSAHDALIATAPATAHGNYLWSSS